MNFPDCVLTRDEFRWCVNRELRHGPAVEAVSSHCVTQAELERLFKGRPRGAGSITRGSDGKGDDCQFTCCLIWIHQWWLKCSHPFLNGAERGRPSAPSAGREKNNHHNYVFLWQKAPSRRWLYRGSSHALDIEVVFWLLGGPVR